MYIQIKYDGVKGPRLPVHKAIEGAYNFILLRSLGPFTIGKKIISTAHELLLIMIGQVLLFFEGFFQVSPRKQTT